MSHCLLNIRPGDKISAGPIADWRYEAVDYPITCKYGIKVLCRLPHKKVGDTTHYYFGLTEPNIRIMKASL